MTSQYAWTIIFGLCAMVLVMRWSFLFLPRRYQPKGALAQALGFAPLAALVAICVPEIMKFQIDRIAAQATTQATTGFLDHLLSDWRLWGGLTMLVTMLVFKHSSRASLIGLTAAALVVFFVR
jgi:branched-subunit amino acid transport protein